MKKLMYLKVLTIPVLLSGCSIPNETFDCPAGQGVGCSSISKVNHGINNGTILKEELTETGFPNQGIAPVVSTVNPSQLDLQQIVLSDKSVIQRGREEHLRIWIAPHQDAENNFHEASIVHTVIRPSYWHLQQIQDHAVS
jgi:type IV conjugative transfer system lipoprotein TraV